MQRRVLPVPTGPSRSMQMLREGPVACAPVRRDGGHRRHTMSEPVRTTFTRTVLWKGIKQETTDSTRAAMSI